MYKKKEEEKEKEKKEEKEKEKEKEKANKKEKEKEKENKKKKKKRKKKEKKSGEIGGGREGGTKEMRREWSWLRERRVRSKALEEECCGGERGSEKEEGEC